MRFKGAGIGIKCRYETAGEATDVVKGTSKRVIVVKAPDPKYFEEAIFIVREEFMSSPGVTRDTLLKEACRAADGYMSSPRKPYRPNIGLIITISSLGGSGLAFAVLKLFGI